MNGISSKWTSMAGRGVGRRVLMIGASTIFGLTLVLSPSQALADSTDTALGGDALAHVNGGQSDTAVGNFALTTLTTGNRDTGIGWDALAFNNADDNTAVGSGALNLNEDGTANTATGFEAMGLGAHGGNNTADGYEALWSVNGGCNNTATGVEALKMLVAGCGDTADGLDALVSNDYANNDTAIGTNALEFTVGNQNAGFVGSENTAIGDAALWGNTTGQDNVAIGAGAGEGATSGSSVNANGGLNTFLGYGTGTNAANNINDSTAIGAGAEVGESHALVLGGTGAFAEKVGIGTASPAYALDVIGTIHTTNTILGNISGSASSFTGNLAGDVTGLQGATTVAELQGYTLDLSAPPVANQLLVFNGNAWVAGDLPGGSNNYIQNGTSLQANASFNIDGTGSIGGSLTVGAGGGTGTLLKVGQPSSRYGSYLELPAVNSTSNPPASDCNATSYVGRMVMQLRPTGDKATLWVCGATGSWLHITP